MGQVEVVRGLREVNEVGLKVQFTGNARRSERDERESGRAARGRRGMKHKVGVLW